MCFCRRCFTEKLLKVKPRVPITLPAPQPPWSSIWSEVSLQQHILYQRYLFWGRALDLLRVFVD